MDIKGLLLLFGRGHHCTLTSQNLKPTFIKSFSIFFLLDYTNANRPVLVGWLAVHLHYVYVRVWIYHWCNFYNVPFVLRSTLKKKKKYIYIYKDRTEKTIAFTLLGVTIYAAVQVVTSQFQHYLVVFLVQKLTLTQIRPWS